MRISGLLAAVLVIAPLWGVGSLAQTNLVETALRSPEDGGPRRWVVDGNVDVFAEPSMNATQVGVFASGAVLSNFGCAEVGGLSWCEVRSFRGGTRGFVDANTLQAAVGPDGVVPMGLDISKRRARARDFDARSEISCAQERGQNMGKCKASIARGGGGDATVVVTFPNGFARQLYFVHGEFVRASATMSGVGTDMDWRLEAGVHFARVDDQRFEITQEFLLGVE